jgi:hypothetical protein
MTCAVCPLSLLCLSGQIILDSGYYCYKCARFNLNLDGTKRNTFHCVRAATQADILVRPRTTPRYCLHCTMSPTVFYDHDLGRKVLYERRTRGARFRLHDFTTGKRISAEEWRACLETT